MRNRNAAATGYDKDLDAKLRSRRDWLAAHKITPAEAAHIHATHPDLAYEHILAVNDRDRARDIDEFIAAGGTRARWRDELRMLMTESNRRAQMELHPYFQPVQYSVEDDTFGFNFDGFYGANPYYADNSSMIFCRVMEWLAIYAAILCLYGVPQECIAAIAMEAAAKLCGYIYGV